MPIKKSLLSFLVISMSCFADPQAQVQCNYDHTRPDDPILMPGQPGMAMSHDFFGNKSTTADSTVTSLKENQASTCDNAADASAYWVPSLRLQDGRIIRPSYQKTYYQASSTAPIGLQPFPDGLELLAGDHKGTVPNPGVIDFLCSNTGYTTDAPTNCGPAAGSDSIQLNIGIQFPNCWDGQHLDPKAYNDPTAVYSSGNTCPADHPIHIPKINMNVAYIIPGTTPVDISQAQLSLDPSIVEGKPVEQWGSIYTAHGDFMNAWTTQGAEFMANLCMNVGMDCGGNVPYAYSKAEDTYVSNLTSSNQNFSQQSAIKAQDTWTDNAFDDTKPASIGLMKFAIPPLPAASTGYPGDKSLTLIYYLRVYGANISSTDTENVYFHVVDNNWDASSVTWNTKPTCDESSAAVALPLTHSDWWTYVDVTSMVDQARDNGKTEISFCLTGAKNGHEFDISASENVHSLTLMQKLYRADN